MRPIAKSEKEVRLRRRDQMVFDSFNSFDPQIAEMAQRVFDQEHVDSEVRKGKARRRLLLVGAAGYDPVRAA
jgi:oligoendopeptidase F